MDSPTTLSSSPGTIGKLSKKSVRLHNKSCISKVAVKSKSEERSHQYNRNYRQSNCTPSTLKRVNNWISSLNTINDNRRSRHAMNDPDQSKKFDKLDRQIVMDPDYYYTEKEDKILEDEIAQYCTSPFHEFRRHHHDRMPTSQSARDYVDDLFNEQAQHSNVKSNKRRRLLQTNMVEKEVDVSDSDSDLPLSPENEKKKELCSYLQLMKPSDKKTVMILQNRRSMRVKNLSIMQERKELEKKLREESDDTVDNLSKLPLGSDDVENTDEKRDRWLKYRSQQEDFHFPQPKEDLTCVFKDFDNVTEEDWFREYKRQSNHKIVLNRNNDSGDVIDVEATTITKAIKINRREESITQPLTGFSKKDIDYGIDRVRNIVANNECIRKRLLRVQKAHFSKKMLKKNPKTLLMQKKGKKAHLNSDSFDTLPSRANRYSIPVGITNGICDYREGSFRTESPDNVLKNRDKKKTSLNKDFQDNSPIVEISAGIYDMTGDTTRNNNIESMMHGDIQMKTKLMSFIDSNNHSVLNRNKAKRFAQDELVKKTPGFKIKLVTKKKGHMSLSKAKLAQAKSLKGNKANGQKKKSINGAEIDVNGLKPKKGGSGIKTNQVANSSVLVLAKSDAPIFSDEEKCENVGMHSDKMPLSENPLKLSKKTPKKRGKSLLEDTKTPIEQSKAEVEPARSKTPKQVPKTEESPSKDDIVQKFTSKRRPTKFRLVKALNNLTEGKVYSSQMLIVEEDAVHKRLSDSLSFSLKKEISSPSPKMRARSSLSKKLQEPSSFIHFLDTMVNPKDNVVPRSAVQMLSDMNSTTHRLRIPDIAEKPTSSRILAVFQYSDKKNAPEGNYNATQFHSQILNIQRDHQNTITKTDLPSQVDLATELPTFISFNKEVATKPLHSCLNSSRRKSALVNLEGEAGSSSWQAGIKPQKKDQHSIQISREGGAVLKIFYLDFSLIICQEFAVSFWTQTALGNVLGAQNMWINKGSVQRSANNNCIIKESLEVVVTNENAIAYVELWTKEHHSAIREGPVADIFAILYFWRKGSSGLDKKVLQLENINGFADDVQYSVLKSSPKIIVSWHVASNEANSKKTCIHCHQLAADFQSVCNISEFEPVDHYVSSLHNIEGCETLIMGSGENRITLWNIERGYVAATIEMSEIMSPLATLWVKCDRGFLFTLQQCVNRELRLIAIHGLNHSWKKLASYVPPEEYDRLKNVCVENGLVLAFYEQGIVCWNAQTAETILEATHSEYEHVSGKYLISISHDQVNVRHAFTHLLSVEES